MSHTWENLLEPETSKPYFQNILELLENEAHNNTVIYPPKHLLFNAIKMTPFDSIKVVILGQDPYHGPGEAHGLCFSVPKNIKTPPSLANIFKELKADLDIAPSLQGDLTPWAQQGVLLLNTSLSVAHKSPGSHSKIGWHFFTDHIIKTVSDNRPFVVFLLWGKHAQSKKGLIDSRHLILESVHPSPLSAHRGFLGCKHFSQTNEALEKNQLSAINWALPT